MRTLLPLALLLLPLHPAEEVVLRYAPADGTVLVRTFDAQARYELTAIEGSVNGEAMEVDEVPDVSMDFREHVAVTDQLETVEDGRPTVLVRTYDGLSQTSAYTTDQGDSESTSTSDLEGRTLRYELDGDEWSITADDDGDDPDGDQVEWLHEDMDLRAVLPPGAVEVGDEWDIGPELYLAFMWPGGLVGWHDAEAEVSDDDEDMNAQTIENLEGSGSVTLEELREEDGVRVAVLHVTLDVETSCESEVELEGGTLTVEVEIERTLEGTILWDLENGHALAAELEGTGSRLTTRSQTIETEEGDFEVEQSELYEGTLTYEATLERR